MKKSLPYIFLVALLSTMFILISQNKEFDNTKVITIDTLHTYLYSKDQKIEIPIYVTGKNHTIDVIDSYDQTYFTNNDNEKLIVNLEEITYSHKERYLDDTYIKYILKFEMPNLTEKYTMKDAYLNIVWLNLEKSTYKIGDLHLNYFVNNSSVSWLSLDSKRDLDSDRCQMDLIEIELETNQVNIENIYISNEEPLIYTFKNNILTIYINKNDLCLNYLPVWIEHDNQIITIQNYHYIIDYDLLSKAGKLINIYVFS